MSTSLAAAGSVDSSLQYIYPLSLRSGLSLSWVASASTCCTSSWVSLGLFRNSLTMAVRSCSCTWQHIDDDSINSNTLRWWLNTPKMYGIDNRFGSTLYKVRVPKYMSGCNSVNFPLKLQITIIQSNLNYLKFKRLLIVKNFWQVKNQTEIKHNIIEVVPSLF